MKKNKINGLLVLAAIALAAMGWQKMDGGEETSLQNREKESVEESSEGGSSSKKNADKGAISKSDFAYVTPKWEKSGVPNQQLQRIAYVTSYNQQTLCPNWVGWVLTSAHTDGENERGGHKFLEDMDVPAPRATYADIREKECGYQRGHMCPAADNKWSYKAQKEAFLMTNICPQNGNLNQRDWKYLEEACRDWALQYGKVYIVAGPIFTSKRIKRVGEHRVAVPDAFFKVVLRMGTSFASGKTTKAIGFIYPNKGTHHDMNYYVCSVDEVEKQTGLDFFSQLPDNIEKQVESQSNLAEW